MTGLDRIGDLLALVLIAAVFALGLGSHGLAAEGAARTLAFSACGLLGAWAVVGWLRGRWNRGELAPTKVFLLMLLLAAGWGFVTVLPIPAPWAEALSPPLREHRAALGAAGFATPPRLPLAHAPERALSGGHQILACLLFFAGTALLATRRKMATGLIAIVAVFAVAEGLLGLWRFLGEGAWRAYGGVHNANHWAAFVAAGLVVALAGLIHWAGGTGHDGGLFSGRDARILLLLPIAAAWAGWLASLSRGSVLSVLAVLGVWGLIEWRGRRGERGGPPVAAALLAAGAVVVLLAMGLALDRLVLRFVEGDFFTANSRVMLWEATARGLAESPWVGLTYGGTEFAINRHAGFPLESIPLWAHSDPLQWICEWGLVAGLPLAALCGVFLWRAWRCRRERSEYLPFSAGTLNRAALAGLAILLLHSLGDFHLRIPSVGFLALVLLALALQSGSCHGGRR